MTLRVALLSLGLLLVGVTSGCRTLGVNGSIHTDADVRAGFQGTVDVRMPAVHDPGPVVPVIVQPGEHGPNSPRVAVIDVDGLLLNQNLTGFYSAGENPVASFQEKLEAAACDPRVRAVVLRINSPGGGVAATDLMAEELKRFREGTGKPCVATILDLGTAGGYYLAAGCDQIVALPTSITGGIGAIVNHANLQDAMAMMNLQVETIKSADLVDMGTVTRPLSEQSRQLFQDLADGFGDRFLKRVATTRKTMSPTDLDAVRDGRILAASKALSLHMIDFEGYPKDAIALAEKLAGGSGSEVVIFQRQGYPTRSLYATAPNVPIQSELIPLSYPGLDRSKLPTFLYLWQPDPTLTKQGGR